MDVTRWYEDDSTNSFRHETSEEEVSEGNAGSPLSGLLRRASQVVDDDLTSRTESANDDSVIVISSEDYVEESGLKSAEKHHELKKEAKVLETKPFKQRMALFVDISDTIEESDFSFTRQLSQRPPSNSLAKSAVSGQLKTPEKINKRLYESPLKQLFANTQSTPTKKPKIEPFMNQLLNNVDLSKYSSKELAEANRVKRSRSELMAEMIIYLPEKFHQHLNETTFEETEVRKTTGNDIYWKRKVNSVYNKSNDVFLPCPKHEIEDTTNVKYYEAEKFINKLTKGDIKVPERTIIMVEQYNQYLSKLSVMENRVYKDKVLGTGKFDKDVEITAKQVESLVNKLEYQDNVNVFPILNVENAIMWLVSFTYTLAFSRYDRSERNIEYSNLQSIKGNDSKSVFIEMMKKFKFMPQAKCERFYNYYNSLYKIYQQLVIGELGKDEDDRRLVPEATEKAMKIVLTSEDPNQVIYE